MWSDVGTACLPFIKNFAKKGQQGYFGLLGVRFYESTFNSPYFLFWPAIVQITGFFVTYHRPFVTHRAIYVLYRAELD